MSEEHAASGGGGLSNPAAASLVPGFPTNFHPQAFQDYSGGLNTRVSRASIKDNELAWCDGFYPMAPNCLRTLWGKGRQIFVTGGSTIRWYKCVNIGSTFWAIILLDDGTVYAAQTGAAGIVTALVLPPGSVFAPATHTFAVSQWGAKYAIMVAPQENGYWLWDGQTIFKAGTVGPEVLVTAGGRGYTAGNPPKVSIGVGQSDGTILPVATAHAEISNGSVSRVLVDSILNTSLTKDSIVIVGFGLDGLSSIYSAFGVFGAADGVIDSVVLTNGGSGYTSVPAVVITDPTGTGALITVNGASGGIITGLKIVAGGTNYTNPVISFSGGGGSGAAATAAFSNGVLNSFVTWNSGFGYRGQPTVNILSPTGSGASATAEIVSTSLATVNIVAGGRGYTSPIYFTLSDGDGPASATIALMPFGVSGTAVEVYKSRVWVSNGRAPFAGDTKPPGRTIFSASGSPVNFGDDGGVFLANDSFTRIGYMSLIQANGFLWLVGDSSLNYISGVTTTTTTGGGVTSTVASFSNVNADPQVGSSWPSSVQALGRNVMLANSQGIYMSAGGNVRKVSDGFDGFYGNGPGISDPGSDFPGAVAVIFGRTVYMLLLPIISPFSGVRENKLLMFDGQRLFTSSQDMFLTFIASVEGNSFPAALGTDGIEIRVLFSQPSSGFIKTAQSKLYANPSYWFTKVANMLHAVLKWHTIDNNISVTIDNESGQGSGNAVTTLVSSDFISFANALDDEVVFENVGLSDVNFAANGVINVAGPLPVGQQGRMIGVTLSTSDGDVELNSMLIQERLETANVG